MESRPVVVVCALSACSPRDRLDVYHGALGAYERRSRRGRADAVRIAFMRWRPDKKPASVGWTKCESERFEQ